MTNAQGSLSPGETRRLLEELDLHPSKRLGQNFLVDRNLVEKSLRLAGISSDDDVIEVGPGLGTLTAALLGAGCRVFAIEKDHRLAAYLDKTLKQAYAERFFLMAGDAIDHPLAEWPEKGNLPYKIVANLPYAISTPWMDAVLEQEALPAKMVLMLQRETADRFLAVTGTKRIGAITFFLQSCFDVERGHRVPRQCFTPVPEVDSYLINLTIKKSPRPFGKKTKELIRACFRQRRKQIATLLRNHPSVETIAAWMEDLHAAGFSPKSRPEEIPLPLWQKLDQRLRARFM